MQERIQQAGLSVCDRSLQRHNTSDKKAADYLSKINVHSFFTSPRGFEPPTPRLGGECSIQLSYEDTQLATIILLYFTENYKRNLYMHHKTCFKLVFFCLKSTYSSIFLTNLFHRVDSNSLFICSFF